jgi:tRNA dimethylallyltransferase
MPKFKHKIIIICGATATGKTSLALKLANRFNKPVSIISVDSRQVYQELPVITGQDIPAKFLPQKDTTPYYVYKNIRLFGLNFLQADKQINLSDFTKLAWKIIRKQLNQNRQIILVGGSGLYLHSIAEKSKQIHIPPNLRLRAKLNKKTVLSLQKILKNKNLAKFNTLNHSDQLNPRRLIRAIEIENASSPPQVDYFSLQKQCSFLWLGLQTDLNSLEKAIKLRVKQRIKANAIAEVQKLLKSYPDTDLPIYSSLGVAQILKFSHPLKRKALVSSWTQAEFSYAKRQITWFKKHKQIICYDINNPDKLIKHALSWLTKK